MTEHALTAAQRAYLKAVVGANAMTSELAGRFGASSDASRKVMNRLEARGLVTGEGVGARRLWTATEKGAVLVGEEETETQVRPYHVFEETGLDRVVGDIIEDSDIDTNGRQAWFEELLTVLKGHPGIRLVTDCEARNTEHACRQAGKVYEDDLSVDLVTMIAVPARSWKPTPVRINTTRTVSVG